MVWIYETTIELDVAFAVEGWERSLVLKPCPKKSVQKYMSGLELAEKGQLNLCIRRNNERHIVL